MRRSTPNRYAERPPFTTSTQTYQRSTTPVAPARRGTSPNASARYRVDFGRAVQHQPQLSTPYQPRVGAHSPASSIRPVSAQRARNSPPMGEAIGSMLTDLVALSHHIERYLRENPGAVQGTSPQRALKAEEIERVVRRVEGHFKARVAELDQIVQEQKDVIIQLSREREMWKKRAENAEQLHKQPLAQHDDIIGDATPREATQRPSDANHLRQVLAEEKRQRLLVEEQTQHLTEQHGKVVHTLEQRIRKQERQLQSMMEALEQHGNSNNGSGVVTSGGGSGTPRSLKFRQRQLRFDDHPPTPDRAAASTSQPSYSGRALSADIAEVIDVSSQQPSGRVSPKGPPPSTVLPLEVDAEMDDVAAFLANISKELESISTVETQRHSKIAALS
jgi:hypothetical protein